MKLTPLNIAFKSVLFHRKESISQFAIAAILTAVISGSLLSGYSVRNSLSRNLEERALNADLIISSGLRYFETSIAGKLITLEGINCVPIIETEGYCTNFITGESELGVNIFGIDSSYFIFQESVSKPVEKGAAIINENLANKLLLKSGDEIILNTKGIDPLPSNAPFAPEEGINRSVVLKISEVIPGSSGGDFSTGTDQGEPLNIFVNPQDISDSKKYGRKANRILISGKNDPGIIMDILSKHLELWEIGFTERISEKSSEHELVSDRIFIDSSIISEITRIIPDASPVLTYLGNSFELGSRSTPYSFISALPESLLPGIGESEIVVSKWLADDLEAKTGDRIKLKWFDPAGGGNLREDSCDFIISEIINNDHKYSDPTLMPEFPGISGRTTCSSWDAGVPLDIDRIRDTDEDYWEKYGGTPKAFINYETGKRLWGNNFGPATAIRFAADSGELSIYSKLSGKIDPSSAGFSVTNLRMRNSRAASEGVDFGTLFLSLSFFIIVSCMMLLSMSVKLFIESRVNEITIYRSTGFRNMTIFRIILYESLIVILTGSIAGLIPGFLVNAAIISGLNNVWNGAVNTDTLRPALSLSPVLTGFFVSFFLSVTLIFLIVRRRLLLLEKGKSVTNKVSKRRMPLFVAATVLGGSVILFIFSLISTTQTTISAFGSGILFFSGMVMLSYKFFIDRNLKKGDLSGTYFRFYPDKAVIPVFFLAAGIFAVMITGANRQVLRPAMLERNGGTGGFVLWAETALPVGYDLNSSIGRQEFGFDEPPLNEMTFFEAPKLNGDDASCLNISYVATPPILGVDPGFFISRGSFSFAKILNDSNVDNAWKFLYSDPGENIVYGIADQSVLQWGLKKKIGDTISFLNENGKRLNIVICGALKSSIFQGHLLIGLRQFERNFPSISGSSIFLVDGKSEDAEVYTETMTQRLSSFGISIVPAGEKLSSFFTVTNTYLDVFMVLGAFGMVLGVAGLGFILLRNFNSRKREFALMLASGFTETRIRSIILKDHIFILGWGIITGILSAIITTWPSVAGGSSIPWLLFLGMLFASALVGFTVIYLPLRRINKSTLITVIRKE